MTVAGQIPLKNIGVDLDSVQLTNSQGHQVQREGIFIGDPDTFDARARVLSTTPADDVYGQVVRNIPAADFYHEVVEGKIADHIHVHKFGRHEGVGTGFVPVSIGGIYRTPQVADATALRVKAGNANDTALGSGARSVLLEGLDETGTFVQEGVPTAGTSAGAASTTTFIRLFRALVLESGTYANVSVGSHAADIVIEKAAGGEDWCTIAVAGFARGQTEIGMYSVPLFFTAYITGIEVNADTAKLTEFMLFQRRDILQTDAPYSALRVIAEFEGNASLNPTLPLGPFPALTDLGFLAKAASGTPEADIDFELLLVIG